jgi:nitrite reductase/ring-hydroxylating ferredoxin subunit
MALRSGLPGADSDDPALVVLAIDDQSSLSLAVALRDRWSDALLVGYLRLPDHELWRAAERSGCDLVTTRGALARSIETLIDQRARGATRRFPLMGVADAAGRLGLIGSFAETAVGPVALYRVAGQWCAIADRCPHAGAPLSPGELDGTVLTCSAHGSQFDVRSGDRLRGPADHAVTSHRVVEENGQLWLEGPAG